MAAATRQRFLPVQVSRALDGLGDLPLPAGQADEPELAAVAEIVAALYHYEFHGRAKAIAEHFDCASDGDAEAAADLGRELTAVLEDANYRRLTLEELEEAVAKELLLPLRLEVDLDDYRELLIYRRASRREQVEVRTWDKLRHEERTVTVDGRLVVHTQVRSAAWFAERGIDPAKRGLVPNRIDLKHFRDVPRANIKTLLPSVRVRFRLVDSLLIGIPALASGIVVLTTKLLTTLGLMCLLIGAWLGLRAHEPHLNQAAMVALFGGLAAVGGFLVRQYSKLKNRRVRYLKVLNEHLYFHTIGHGSEVVHALLYSAEQQEVAEVLLGYRFLLAMPHGATAAELDAAVERWLVRACERAIDFDVADAVTKLRGLALVEAAPAANDGAEVLRARPVAAVRADLLARWAALFDASGTDAPAVPVTKARTG